MKIKPMIIFCALFLTFSSIVFGQEIKFTNLETASRGEFTSYISKDGAVYKIGDRIKIGIPSSGKTFAFYNRRRWIFTPNYSASNSCKWTRNRNKKNFYY